MRRRYKNEFIVRCQGCTIIYICNLPDIKNGTPCPCIECLVKPMCNHECNAFSEYWIICHPDEKGLF